MLTEFEVITCQIQLSVNLLIWFSYMIHLSLCILTFVYEFIYLGMLYVRTVLRSKTRFHQRKFIVASASTAGYFQLEINLKKKVLSLRYFVPVRLCDLRLVIATNSQGKIVSPFSKGYASWKAIFFIVPCKEIKFFCFLMTLTM